MKAAVKIAFLVVVLTAGTVYAIGWPPDYTEVVPQKPGISDVIAITFGGEWQDGCIPNDSNSSLDGNDVYIDVILDYPPAKIVCTPALEPWSQTEYIGPLAEGSYTVYARVIEDPNEPGAYTEEAEFTVYYCETTSVGDINANCFVDFVDFGYIAEAWNSSPGNDNWDAACDISEPNDNFIDELDLKVFAEMWLAET
jgi:hypothetical protein